MDDGLIDGWWVNGWISGREIDYFILYKFKMEGLMGDWLIDDGVIDNRLMDDGLMDDGLMDG